jgi:hypothetical protein
MKGDVKKIYMEAAGKYQVKWHGLKTKASFGFNRVLRNKHVKIDKPSSTTIVRN